MYNTTHAYIHTCAHSHAHKLAHTCTQARTHNTHTIHTHTHVPARVCTYAQHVYNTNMQTYKLTHIHTCFFMNKLAGTGSFGHSFIFFLIIISLQRGMLDVETTNDLTWFIGASLSKHHTSGTAFWKCACMLVATYRKF